jgi:hypothetical protein
MSCEPCKEQNLLDEINKEAFVNFLIDSLSSDSAKLMMALDNFRVLNVNVNGSKNLNDSIILDYTEKEYLVEYNKILLLVKEIESKTSSKGHLLVKYGMSKLQLPTGNVKNNLFNNFSLHFEGLDNSYVSLQGLKEKFSIGTNFSIRDTANYPIVNGLLSQNGLFGFSKYGNHGISFEISKVKQYLLKHKYPLIYIYPTVNLDFDHFHTNLVFSNKADFRTNFTTVNSKDEFANRGTSCCPPQN